MNNKNGVDNITEAKRRLPLPQLMEQLGYRDRARKKARCPFHRPDRKPSFSVFTKGDAHFFKCFTGCGEGDEISFLALARFGGDVKQALPEYLRMAGIEGEVSSFSVRRPEFHQYPQFPDFPVSPQPPECPLSPLFPESPMSNGQGLEEELRALAARTACTERKKQVDETWELARGLLAVQLRLRRKLGYSELMQTFNEWHRLSQPFLDPAKSHSDYLAALLAQLGKVRVPTGQGDTLNKALKNVSSLEVSECPLIPNYPDAPPNWRRIAALHRELSRLTGGNTYFLTCRHAAKAASPGVSYQTAYSINLALVYFGVIEIVRVGDPRPGGKASQFRYLLSQSDNGAPEDGDPDHLAEI
jgi:hypothetical protein